MGPPPQQQQKQALSVEHSKDLADHSTHTTTGHHQHRTGQHKTVPRWLRMSLRTSLLVGLIALPTLAVKEPSFANLTKYKGFSILFASLGAFIVPMWIPLLGDVVMAFTAIIPIGLAGLWLSYGLFLALPNITFMMLMCVVLGGGVFFLAELFSLPVGLLSIFPTLFIVGANVFVQKPAKAWTVAVMVTALLFVAAVVAITVCALVFPEYCVDEVFRHHHEALEHLLHLAYYAMGLRPPALLRRVYSSAAAGMGTAKWRAAFKAADDLPTNLQALAVGETDPLLGREASGVAGREASAAADGGKQQGSGAAVATAGAVPNKANVKTERSWHRVALACQAGAKAQAGASAEVVLMAAHGKRIILPCSPLIPCAKGQLDTAGLTALRHLALRTALHIIKIYNATQPLDAATEALLQQLLSEQEWSHMRASLLASLQELTDTFPMDYYPTGAPPDRRHLLELHGAVSALQQAWRKAGAAAVAAQQQQQQPPTKPKQQPAAVAVPAPDMSREPSEQQSAAAAGERGDAFTEPLVLDDSPAALVFARMNAVHLMRLLQELVGLLEELYDVVQQVSERVLSCKFGC